LPVVGARARIVHFGGGVEQTAVLAVHDAGRRLEVRDESGATLEFVLNPATARFVSSVGARGPRLELIGERAGVPTDTCEQRRSARAPAP
jgi:hypothetical protein